MTTMILGQQVQFFLTSLGDDGNSKPSSFSARVSDYSNGYVVVNNGNAQNNVGILVVGKAVGTFDLTITGHSQDGTQMAPLVRSYTVTPVPVPQATHFGATDDVVQGSNFLTPGDPGTDTVTGTL